MVFLDAVSKRLAPEAEDQVDIENAQIVTEVASMTFAGVKIGC